jgi:hypothetical protein
LPYILDRVEIELKIRVSGFNSPTIKDKEDHAAPTTASACDGIIGERNLLFKPPGHAAGTALYWQ